MLITHAIEQRRISYNYFTESQVWSYAQHITQALLFMHSKKIVHRDIKCENILITDSNIAKIADLGLSRYLKRGKFHSVTGTPDYFSPEMIKEGSYDEKVSYNSGGHMELGLCAL